MTVFSSDAHIFTVVSKVCHVDLTTAYNWIVQFRSSISESNNS